MFTKHNAKKRSKKTLKKAKSEKRVIATRSNSQAASIDVQVMEVDRPPASFRGLMPTPPEVQEIMDQMERERPMSDSFRRLQTDDLNEQYYFGGNCIAYRNTPQGREILAVGWDEIDRLEKKRMSKMERRSIVLGFAEPW
jgi:hypothetical protein